ncbi:MAG TPA: hypothetical protein VF594_11530 [Rubricoccaceae bacterium]|jgi:hypothetical protein
MTAPPTIATWLYAESADEQSHYPQVVGKGAPSSARFQAVYWRCVALFFATSQRQNPGARHVLYTNADRVPSVDGHDLGALLERWGVEVVRLPYTFQPPEGYFGAWRNQFYVFDIIRDLAARLEDDEVGLVLDSDCVWVRPGERLVAATRRAGALTYDLGIDPDEVQNGLSQTDARALYAEVLAALGLDRPPPEAAPAYIGGELISATGATLRTLDALADPLWDEMLRRHAAGLPRFYEEAQALSFLYYALGILDGTANAYVRRIWTMLLKGDDARSPDLGLTVWHVPAEKRYGIPRLFAEAMKPESLFWTSEPGALFRHYVGRSLGIPRRTAGKLARDLPAAFRDKARARFGR